MSPAEFLRDAAERAFSGRPIDYSHNSPAAMDALSLTMPCYWDPVTPEDMVATRPMRLLLAAAIAESEGR